MARRRVGNSQTSSQPPSVTPIHADGAFLNSLTGINTSVDKRIAASPYAWQALEYNWRLLEALYANSDIAGKVVDFPVEDATRAWFKFSQDDDRDTEQTIMQSKEMRKFRATFPRALKFARLYGGAGLILGVDDGKPADQPVDKKNIRAIRWMNPVSRWRLSATLINDDPYSENYGLPEYYMLAHGYNPQEQQLDMLQTGQIHHSRVIRLEGPALPETIKRQNAGWGASVLSKLWQALSSYDQSYDVAATKVQDFNQSVYKKKGLAQILATPGGAQKLRTLYNEMEVARSVLRALVIDADDDYQQYTTNLGGLAAALDRIESRLIPALDGIPPFLVFGTFDGGMSEKADSAIAAYHERIAQDQENILRPAIEYFLELLMPSKEGPTKGKLLDNWTIEFNPLDKPDQAAISQQRKTDADTMAIWIDKGVLKPEEVRESVFGGEGYSTDIILKSQKKEEQTEEAPAPAPQLLQIVTAVASKQIPRDSGLEILKVGFNLSDKEAEAIMADAGDGFEAQGGDGASTGEAGQKAPAEGQEPAPEEGEGAGQTEEDPGEETPGPADTSFFDSDDIGLADADSVRVDLKCKDGRDPCGKRCLPPKQNCRKKPGEKEESKPAETPAPAAKSENKPAEGDDTFGAWKQATSDKPTLANYRKAIKQAIAEGKAPSDAAIESAGAAFKLTKKEQAKLAENRKTRESEAKKAEPEKPQEEKSKAETEQKETLKSAPEEASIKSLDSNDLLSRLKTGKDPNEIKLTPEQLSKAKKFYEESFANSDESVHLDKLKADGKLTDDQAKALSLWISGAGYESMSRQQWDKSVGIDDSVVANNLLASQALHKLPSATDARINQVVKESAFKSANSEETDSYSKERGLSRWMQMEDPSGFAKRYQDSVGKEITEENFFATTYRNHPATSTYKNYGFFANVEYKITPNLKGNGQGKIIDQYKESIYEGEILYPPGSKFKIKAVNPPEKESPDMLASKEVLDNVLRAKNNFEVDKIMGRISEKSKKTWQDYYKKKFKSDAPSDSELEKHKANANRPLRDRWIIEVEEI